MSSEPLNGQTRNDVGHAAPTVVSVRGVGKEYRLGATSSESPSIGPAVSVAGS